MLSNKTSTIIHRVSQEVLYTTFGFEMPNEALNISEKSHRIPTSCVCRKIVARGDGELVDISNMPFLSPGLQLRDISFVTSRQFLIKRDARVASNGKHGVTYNWGSMKLCIGFCLLV